MQYRYTAILISADDGVYATVPDLPGCATRGRDMAEALLLIEDAMGGWLCVAEDEQMPIAPPTPRHQFTLAPGSVCSLVQVDTAQVRATTDSCVDR